jgi:SAM-dependent methyltransferase
MRATVVCRDSVENAPQRIRANIRDSGPAMRRPGSSDQRIDYTAVRRYFQAAGNNTAATASYMAHEQNLPESSVRYRMRKEIATIADWLDAVPQAGRVLDLGCGAGTWTKIFANRYDGVVGIEQSPSMVAAARTLLARFPNAKIVEGDVRKDLPAGPFDLIFLGGLCMYLNDPDAVAILRSLKARLASGASIILRETTVPKGELIPPGDYQAVYRSVRIYQDLFREAGFPTLEFRRNYAYTSMEVAVELVETRRKNLRFLPAQSPFLGALTWYSLRAIAPLTFWLFPRVLSRLQIDWPRLQNHFFRLRAPESS